MVQGLPEIHESAESLRELMRSEPRGRQRQRLHLLYLFACGQAKSRTHAAQLLGVGRPTVRKWLNRYAVGGVPGLLQIDTHTNREPALTPEAKERLRQQLADPTGFPSYGAIQVWLANECGVTLPYKTVYKIVRYDLKAQLKVPRKAHIKKQGSGGSL